MIVEVERARPHCSRTRRRARRAAGLQAGAGAGSPLLHEPISFSLPASLGLRAKFVSRTSE